MKKLNKTCCVCHKQYSYCPSCGEDRDKPTWMNSFCSENCKNVYEAAAGYSGKAYSAQEAKTLLDMCDLSDKDHFTPATQKLIKEIYEIVAQEEKVEATSTLSEEKVEQNYVQQKTNFKKKNKKK